MAGMVLSYDCFEGAYQLLNVSKVIEDAAPFSSEDRYEEGRRRSDMRRPQGSRSSEAGSTALSRIGTK